MKKGDFLSEEEIERRDKFGGKIKSRKVFNLPKKIATGLVALVAFVGAATLVGCGPTEEPPVQEIPTEKITAVLDNMEKDNYTYSHTSENGEINYLLAGNKMKTVADGEETYYDASEETPYTLTYDKSDELWHKTETTAVDFDSLIYDDLAAAKWTAYDESTNEFTGTMNGQTVTLEISSNGSVNIEGNEFESEIYDIGTTTVTLPDKSLIADDGKEEVPVEAINDFVVTLEKGNYTYSKLENGIIDNYLFDGDTWHIFENKDTNGYYYYVENGKSYLLNYDNSDKMWHKTETELRDVNDFIYDDLISATWTSYDKDKQVYYGTMDGEEVSFEFTSTGAIICGDGFEKTIYSVGNTAIKLPDDSKIIDDTVTPEPPIVETDKIYEIKNGEYVFNIPAMVEVLNEKTSNGTTWLEDYYKNDMFELGKDRYVQDIVFVNPTSSTFEIGLTMTRQGVDYFDVISNQDNSWAEFIANSENNTVAKFREYLQSAKKPFYYSNAAINYEYSTENANSTELSEFNQMTENILTKIATKGIQTDSIKNPCENPIPEYENANVIFGFKTPAGGTSAGLDMGYVRSWEHYYILEVDGKLEFVNIRISSSITINNATDEKENVLNAKDNGYMITKVDRKEIDKGNQELYKDNSAQATVTVYYSTEKEREL